MTYTEFFEIAKTRPWKTIECETGKECWCRMITTDPPVDDHFVATWGSIDKDTAEYIVELHNQRLSRINDLDHNIESYNKDVLKEYVLDNEIVTLDDFDNDDVIKHLDLKGYYVFEDDSDIQTYVEDDMGCYVFDREDDVFEYTKMNDSNYQQFDSVGKDIVGMFRYKDTIDLIDKLAKKNGWDWIYEKLMSC